LNPVSRKQWFNPAREGDLKSWEINISRRKSWPKLRLVLQERRGFHRQCFRLFAIVGMWEKCGLDRYCSRGWWKIIFAAFQPALVTALYGASGDSLLCYTGRVWDALRAARVEGRNMRWKRCFATLTVIGLTQSMWPARSAEMTFDDYWHEANGAPGKSVKEFPNFTQITAGDGTVYLFTKPNNPAHPGVIVRKLVNESDGTYMDTDGHSFGPDSAQPAFKAWMNNPWAPQPNSN
jgi:hypothetical protein